MKNALVLGAGGFIGSHLVEFLMNSGYSVRAMVRYNSHNSHGWLDTFSETQKDQIEVVTGDIRDIHTVEQVMTGMDVVFHLAALISIPYSFQAPDLFAAVNIAGTLNVLQAARKLKTPRLLITSTSEVYGTAQYVPMDEEHPLQAQSPYSASKIGADQMAMAFYRSFDLPLTIVRPFNTYGPRQSARALIPTVIIQLLNQIPEVQLGDLRPTRDWVYVEDTVRAFEAIVRSQNTIGEVINIATQQECSVGRLVGNLIEQISPTAKVIQDPQRIRPGKSEVERLLGANAKIKEMTDWFPQYDLESGLTKTIDWFAKKENLRTYKHKEYNI